jgi:DNA-directed RNA polymerase subunit RPC12/RpoP
MSEIERAIEKKEYIERTGRWIEDDTVYCGAGMRWYKCSSCNERVFTALKGSKGYRFCPDCGAHMERSGSGE